jgi:hypothetical protein
LLQTAKANLTQINAARRAHPKLSTISARHRPHRGIGLAKFIDELKGTSHPREGNMKWFVGMAFATFIAISAIAHAQNYQS